MPLSIDESDFKIIVITYVTILSTLQAYFYNIITLDYLKTIPKVDYKNYLRKQISKRAANNNNYS